MFGKMLETLREQIANTSFQDIIHPFIADKPVEVPKPVSVLRIANNFPVYHQICNAEIVKRTQHIFLQCLLKPDLTGDIVIKFFIHVESRGIRACRHTQPQIRVKIIEDLLIARRTDMMRFIPVKH